MGLSTFLDSDAKETSPGSELSQGLCKVFGAGARCVPKWYFCIDNFSSDTHLKDVKNNYFIITYSNGLIMASLDVHPFQGSN